MGTQCVCCTYLKGAYWLIWMNIANVYRASESLGLLGQEWDWVLLLEYPHGASLRPEDLARGVAKDRFWLDLMPIQVSDSFAVSARHVCSSSDTLLRDERSSVI